MKAVPPSDVTRDPCQRGRSSLKIVHVFKSSTAFWSWGSSSSVPRPLEAPKPPVVLGGALSPDRGDEEAPPGEMDDCEADALLPLLPGFVTEAG